MIPIEIILVILGIAAVILSYFITEKVKVNEPTLSSISDRKNTNISLTNENTEYIRQKINEIISESTQDVIEKADDQLSKMSNEKIMIVSDFTDQILEKINQNHQEVIFLYNMLNEKDNEIKDVLKRIEKVKSTKQEATSFTENNEVTNEIVNTSETSLEKNEDNQIAFGNLADESKRIEEENLYEPITSNNNDLILAYHEQGMSIMEIAKNLCLGQGEVKLVIDLFQGEKK